MTTRVRFHIDTAAALDAWEQTLVGDARGAPALRQLLLTELKQRLIDTAGLPADRFTSTATDPPTYFVQIDGRTWVRYFLKDERTGLISWSREVVIISLGPRPVDPTARSSPPR